MVGYVGKNHVFPHHVAFVQYPFTFVESARIAGLHGLALPPQGVFILLTSVLPGAI